MGANTFWMISEGKTASEAFAAAVREARHMHGHGGYTGTIAEKNDFVVIDIVAETESAIRKLVASRAALTVTAQKRYAKEREAKIKAGASPWSLPEAVIDSDRLYEMRAGVTKQIGALRKKGTRAEALASVLLGEGDRRIDDKWGPAGCVRVSAKKWLFFGYASS